MSHQSDLISTDIDEYLAQHERKELLRLLTCGSVDDGKSTLIGRLLHDSKLIYEDQLEAVKADSVKSGTTGDDFDLALLVDGLQAEREQGITIDVAYRYFSTSKRKFIIADTPGHEQYTRNMATGASTCNLAIILIDARHGILTQTKRHSFITSLLGIKHVLVAINKMDLMDYQEEVFTSIKDDYLAFSENLDIADIRFMPISALTGANVVNLSAEMPWYQGPPLMEILETIEIASDRNFETARFPVQYVNRPNLNFRGYCGTVASGIFHKGDNIVALPSRKTSTVRSIVSYDGELEEAHPPMAVTLTLEDEIDISRGDMLVTPDNLPDVADKFAAMIVWMTEQHLTPGKQYTLKQATQTVTGSISLIHHRVDVNTLDHFPTDHLALNEIGLCEVSLTAPIAFDRYCDSKGSGSFIIIDRLTNVTIGAGMVAEAIDLESETRSVSKQEREARFGQKPVTLWLTGTDSSAVAQRLERKLFDSGHACNVLSDTSIGTKIAAITEYLMDAGLICICTIDRPTKTEDDENLYLSCNALNENDIMALLKQKHYLLS